MVGEGLSSVDWPKVAVREQSGEGEYGLRGHFVRGRL